MKVPWTEEEINEITDKWYAGYCSTSVPLYHHLHMPIEEFRYLRKHGYEAWLNHFYS